MPTIRYRNVETGSVSTYGSTIPQLERSELWERVDETSPAPEPDVEPDVEPDGYDV